MDNCIYGDFVATDERTPTRSVVYEATCKVCGQRIRGRKGDMLKATMCRHVDDGAEGYQVPYSNIKDKGIKYVFEGMMQRCYKPYSASYQWYGGKGIKVCDEWQKNPEAFEAWVKREILKRFGIDRWQGGMSIDRINPDGDYCPGNCRVVTLEENARNAAASNQFEVNGQIRTGREWAEYFGKGNDYFNRYKRKHGHGQTVSLIESLMERTRQLNL